MNGISNSEQRASIILTYTPVPGTTTGAEQTSWDFVSGLTPIEPSYPGGSGLVLAGEAVSGPMGSNLRYKITLPAYTGYTYEIYGNPTLADLEWKALPFSLSQMGAIDRNKYAPTANGTLSFFVEQKAVKDFYYVSFRMPGANTGTP